MTDLTSHPIMSDFVFGGIESDEARLLATERAAHSGIRHFHRIEPADPAPGQPVTLTVQVGPDVSLDRLSVYFTADGSDPAGSQGMATHGQAVALAPVATRWEPLLWDFVTTWQGALPPQPEGTLVHYRIEGWRSYGAPVSVWSREMNIDRTAERPTLYGYHVDRFATPAWAHEAILYQVFVDRFSGITNRWLAPVEMNNFAGGTLRGVIERLDYLAALGINTVWLTPVFATASYHGYDTSDYFQVDPRFGSNADLHELFAQAHRRGLRVILDFVANHTAVTFAPFVAAQQNPASPYRSWFSFDPSYKNGYRAFFDEPSMPQMDTDVPAVRDYLARAAQHWLAAGADGLRLDYAAGPSHVFWSAFRAACRAVKPDCWLFGEVTRAGDMLRAYTGRLDGCLDFSFCRATRMLCAHAQPLLGIGQYVNQVVQARGFFGDDFVLPSFIDNHDMNRFLWVAGDDKQRLRLALGLMFGLGGPPILYYGTEVGLSQPRGKGPWREEARHPMLWGEAQETRLLAYVRRLIALRRSHPALRTGSLATCYLDETHGLWLGERVAGSDRVLLAVNAGDAAGTLPLPPGRFLDADEHEHAGEIGLEPRQIVFLTATTA